MLPKGTRRQYVGTLQRPVSLTLLPGQSWNPRGPGVGSICHLPFCCSERELFEIALLFTNNFAYYLLFSAWQEQSVSFLFSADIILLYLG